MTSLTKRRKRIDYYTVYLPEDVYDFNLPSYTEDICNLAILEAQDRTKLYVIPCIWTAEIVEYGYELKIRVKRHRKVV